MAIVIKACLELMETEQNNIDYSNTVIADRYRLISLIGKGGMGAVYIAEDNYLDNKKIAIKILHPSLCRDSELIIHFFREVKILQSINHSNVVRIFDISKDNDLYFYTMEYIPGKMLDDYVKNNNLDMYQFADLIIQICKGLEAIHNKGIIHRDLKPANIIISNSADVKIADFGVAVPASIEDSMNRDIIGTIQYLSPEVIRGDIITTASDFYSLGILLYYLTTGLFPFEDSDDTLLMYKHVHETPKSVISIQASASIWLSELIDQLLSKSPDLRPKSAREIIRYVRKNVYNDLDCLDSGVLQVSDANSLSEEDLLLDSSIFEIKSGSRLLALYRTSSKLQAQEINKYKYISYFSIAVLATLITIIIYSSISAH